MYEHSRADALSGRDKELENKAQRLDNVITECRHILELCTCSTSAENSIRARVTQRILRKAEGVK